MRAVGNMGRVGVGGDKSPPEKRPQKGLFSLHKEGGEIAPYNLPTSVSSQLVLGFSVRGGLLYNWKKMN